MQVNLENLAKEAKDVTHQSGVAVPAVSSVVRQASSALQSDAVGQRLALAWPVRALKSPGTETVKLCFQRLHMSRCMQGLSSWTGSPYVQQGTRETLSQQQSALNACGAFVQHCCTLLTVHVLLSLGMLLGNACFLPCQRIWARLAVYATRPVRQM